MYIQPSHWRSSISRVVGQHDFFGGLNRSQVNLTLNKWGLKTGIKTITVFEDVLFQTGVDGAQVGQV